MILQFLVPQYNEDEKVIKKLLDSISLQQHLDFKDIEMLICNDGSKTLLSNEFLQQYPFNIVYMKEKHRGVSATRNTLLKAATADYVMYCDADDMFYSTHDFYKIIKILKNKTCEMLIGTYIMEGVDVNQNLVYETIKGRDYGCHGNFYSREFLIERQIFWRESLNINEDYYYKGLVLSERPKIEYYEEPFYMYTYNPQSVTRQKNFNYLGELASIEVTNELIKELLKRKNIAAAKEYCTSLVYSCFYCINTSLWRWPEAKQYKHKYEMAFKRFYLKYQDLFLKTPMKSHCFHMQQERVNYITFYGDFMESITFQDWINHIINLK